MGVPCLLIAFGVVTAAFKFVQRGRTMLAVDAHRAGAYPCAFQAVFGHVQRDLLGVHLAIGPRALGANGHVEDRDDLRSTLDGIIQATLKRLAIEDKAPSVMFADEDLRKAFDHVTAPSFPGSSPAACACPWGQP
ncbi:hypothetical protein D3C76_905880 [compost metagenome]